MKTKKLLSVLSAAAVSASAFAGLALTASAYDTLPVVYAGDADTADTKAITTKGNHNTKSATLTLDSGVSEDLKSLFDSNSDETIDDKYTSSYFNYIGSGDKDVDGQPDDKEVNISVDLEAGSYTMYYLASKPGTIESITLSDGAKYAAGVGSYIKLSGNAGVYPITLILPEDYKGNIAIDNTDGKKAWMPDLYSITIVEADLKTQQDVIVASDLSRNDHADQIHSMGSSYTVEENCPEEVKTSFGNDLSKAGFNYLSFTDGTDDHVYMNITEAGTYAVDILDQANNSTAKIEFIKLADDATVSVSVNDKKGKVAASETESVYYHTSASNVELQPGIYKVRFAQEENARYYGNVIAMALRDVSEPEPAKTLEMTNMGKFEGTDGSVATAFTADFKSSELEAAKAKTVTISLGEDEQVENVDTTVISGGADVVYGLIVNNMNDTAKAAKAVITFE